MINALESFTNDLINYVGNILLQAPKLILSIFIMLFVLFYSFKDGKEFINDFIDMLPLREKSKKLLLNFFLFQQSCANK